MATADLFASAFGFKQLQNQHQENGKEGRSEWKKSKTTKKRKGLNLKLFWRNRKKNWSDGCERERTWTTGTGKRLKTNSSESNV